MLHWSITKQQLLGWRQSAPQEWQTPLLVPGNLGLPRALWAKSPTEEGGLVGSCYLESSAKGLTDAPYVSVTVCNRPKSSRICIIITDIACFSWRRESLGGEHFQKASPLCPKLCYWRLLFFCKPFRLRISSPPFLSCFYTLPISPLYLSPDPTLPSNTCLQSRFCFIYKLS